MRKDLLNAVNERAEGLAFYGLDANKKTVLVTGGSLGAGSINKAMVRWLRRLRVEGRTGDLAMRELLS